MKPEYIQDIITMAKSDKSLAQPWANYGIKKLQEAIAMFNMAKQITNLKPPAGMDQPSAEGFVKTDACTCPAYPHATDSACPVHGK